jgi:type I restriction enzyme S subunit
MDVKSDWITRRLGDVATLQRGFDLPHRNRVQGSIPIVTSSGVEDFHNVWKSQGPGVITGRYGTIGEVFYVSSYYWPHNTTLYVKDFHGNVPRYIYYLLKTVDFASHSGKSGVPGVNRNDLHQEFVKILPPLAEQEAIAGALTPVLFLHDQGGSIAQTYAGRSRFNLATIVLLHWLLDVSLSRTYPGISVTPN